MHDAFAYCAESGPQADRDRYLAALFAPAEHRDALLRSMHSTSRSRACARWRAKRLPAKFACNGGARCSAASATGRRAANPVAAALLATIERYRLAADRLVALIEARRFDLYDEPIANMAAT